MVGAALFLLLTVGDGALLGAQPAMLAEAFRDRVRYSGIALSRELSAALIGGTIPLVATTLLGAGGSWLVSAYMVALFLLAGVGAHLIRTSHPNTGRGASADRGTVGGSDAGERPGGHRLAGGND